MTNSRVSKRQRTLHGDISKWRPQAGGQRWTREQLHPGQNLGQFARQLEPEMVVEQFASWIMGH